MKHQALALAAAIAFSSFSLNSPAQQNSSAGSSEQAILVCPVTSRSGETSFDLSLRVSYTAATVNDLPAQISDAEIRWEQCGSDSYCNYYILNRYTGSLIFGSKSFPNLYSGQCSKQTEKKF